MLHALGVTGGHLVSLDRPQGPFNAIGKALLAEAPVELKLAPHRLIEEDSARAIPQLHRDGEMYDLIFVDGWKTFDHLAAEAFYLTRMLRVGGVIMFDDAHMPSVAKVIRLLQTHYQHQEIDYRRYGHSLRRRAFEIATSKSRLRPYRAFTKVRSEADLPVTQDWNFFARF
jgi:predicted O-methyltransferase YrrM